MEGLNPLLDLDYPDPDVIRVGDVYYMVSTTMHFMPGCEILRSYDLVNWEHAAYVYDRLDGTPGQRLEGRENIYGKGMWAASLRYHRGMFYICFVANDTQKTYLFTSSSIEGLWVRHEMEGFYHDCSLLFDEDGSVYIAYGNRDIYITQLKPDLSAPLEGGLHRLAVSDTRSTCLGYEGTHFYKIGGKYYLFFIHSLEERWMRVEACFCADSLEGEFKGGDVLADDMGYCGQGVAQGGIVDTPEGAWYAILFQDRGAVGRIPVLVPVAWEQGWPVFGKDGRVPREVEVASARPGYAYEPLVGNDDFREGEPEIENSEKCFVKTEYGYTKQPGDAEERGKQKRRFGCFGLKSAWQFNHEPDLSLMRLDRELGILWMETDRIAKNLLQARNTLTQRMLFPGCAGEVSVDFNGLKDGDYAGICALQGCYGMVCATKCGGKHYIVMRAMEGEAPSGQAAPEEKEWECVEVEGSSVRLRVEADFTDMQDKAKFYYLDGAKWRKIGVDRKLYFRLDHFTGCRFGLFLYSTLETGGRAGFSDFRYYE